MAVLAFFMDIQEGHLLPSFGLATMLKKRGHTVIFVSAIDNRQYIIEQGFLFYPAFEKLYPRGWREILKQRTKVGVYTPKIEIGHLDLLINGELDSFFREYRPDLLIVSTFLKYEALILHYKYNINPVIFTPYLREKGNSLTRECFNEIVNFADDASRIVEFLFSKGIRFKTLDQLLHPLSLFPELVVCPREFEMFDPEQSGHVHYIGPAIREGRPGYSQDILKPLPADKRIIYASLGSQVSNYDQYARAFFAAMIRVMGYDEMRDFHLLLTVKGVADKSSLPAIPKNVDIYDWVPQTEILKRASIAVTHGGLGTVKECIFYGVPMIVVPIAHDQPSNGKRVEFHHLGKALNIHDLSESLLKECILSVAFDENIKRSVLDMQYVFRAQQESECGAQIIENILSNRNRWVHQ